MTCLHAVQLPFLFQIPRWWGFQPSKPAPADTENRPGPHGMCFKPLAVPRLCATVLAGRKQKG